MSYTSKNVFATLPRTERGTPLVLGADPKGVNFLYTHGNSVIIRNLANPEHADVYTQHSCPVNVAKYSPSGFYISSADKSGKIRIWDTVNKEHILKNEYQPISGPVKDLAWSQDNQRIVCVGEGREKFGHVFLADTGTSNGDITGQTRPVNSCDFKPSRPFRIVTGSEDNTSAVYEGPPFKFKGTKTEHSRYVQAVRYSPDGNYWASAGFDGKVFIYEAKDSTLLHELKDGDKNAHGGGVYGIAWSPDSKQLLSASGDKTCRIWNAVDNKLVCEFIMGTSVDDQQLGCLWSGDYLVSVSLSGHINYMDPKNPGKPSMVIEGHNKPVTTMTISKDGKTIFTGGSDGRVLKWNSENGEARRVQGPGHESQVNCIDFKDSDNLFTLGIDDTFRIIESSTFLGGSDLKLGGQPKCGASVKDLQIVVTVNGSVIFIQNGAKVNEIKMSYEPTCVSINEELNHVAIGDASSKIHVYSLVNNSSFSDDKISEMTLGGALTNLSYSPDHKYLVSSDSNRKVTLFDSKYEKANNKEWGFHTAKVNCVAWSPDSKFVVSGGLDCAIIVWSVQQPAKHLILQSAHIQSQITAVKWLDNKTVVSAGQDSNVKLWEINF